MTRSKSTSLNRACRHIAEHNRLPFDLDCLEKNYMHLLTVTFDSHFPRISRREPRELRRWEDWLWCEGNVNFPTGHQLAHVWFEGVRDATPLVLDRSDICKWVVGAPVLSVHKHMRLLALSDVEKLPLDMAKAHFKGDIANFRWRFGYMTSVVEAQNPSMRLPVTSLTAR